MEPVTFTLPAPPSVNAIYRNVRGKGRVRTKLYDDFLSFATASIRRQEVEPVKGNVVVLAGLERTSALSDLDNRLKAMLDVIVKAELIEDDRFVTAIAAAWLPRRKNCDALCHVTIFPVQRFTLDFYPAQRGGSGTWLDNKIGWRRKT